MSTTITHGPARLVPSTTATERLLLRGTLRIQAWVTRRVERRSRRPDLSEATERRRFLHATGRLGDPRL